MLDRMPELRLEKMVHGGVALARLPEGRVVLVSGGIPGELVAVEPEQVSGVLRGQVLEVLEPSPDRVPAPAHPGLDLGHVSYDRQLELKRDVVADALRRALQRDVDVPPLRRSPQVWTYRATVQPAVASDGLGYRRPGSSDVVVLERDPVANAAIQAAWATWRGMTVPDGIVEVVFRGNDSGEVLAALVATVEPRNLLDFAHVLVRAGYAGVHHAAFDPRGRFRGGVERLAGARTIRQRYGDVELEVTPTAFAQPNPAAAGELYRDLADWAPGGGSALDLYAGGGAIAMHLSPRYEQVRALEIDRGSVARGRRDVERHGLSNVDVARADARRVHIPPGTDLVAVDPPRAGLARELRDAIVASDTPHLLYVSCDVATWARDVAHFLDEGFALDRFEPFDFFPHTHHVEVLSLLTRA